MLSSVFIEFGCGFGMWISLIFSWRFRFLVWLLLYRWIAPLKTFWTVFLIVSNVVGNFFIAQTILLLSIQWFIIDFSRSLWKNIILGSKLIYIFSVRTCINLFQNLINRGFLLFVWGGESLSFWKSVSNFCRRAV